MSILSEFKTGLQAFSEAMSFIRKNRLRHYFIYPLALSILYWLGGYQIIDSITQWVSDSIYGRLDLEPRQVEEGTFSFFWSILETMKGWYNDGYTAILSFVVRIMMWILLFVVGKYLLLAALSPVLALLSEKSEEILTGNRIPFNLGQFIKDVGRGVLVALRNLFAELGMLTLLWLGTFIIPILAPLTVILAFLISSFYYGFSMIDYINERDRKGLRESFQFIRNHRGLTIALGLGIAAGMAVPLIGFIIASFVSILGAVAAVIAIKVPKEINESQNKDVYIT
jgi:CysZ protein